MCTYGNDMEDNSALAHWLKRGTYRKDLEHRSCLAYDSQSVLLRLNLWLTKRTACKVLEHNSDLAHWLTKSTICSYLGKIWI